MGLFQAIFGGGKSKKSAQSESGNKNLDFLNTTFGPTTQYAGQGAGGIASFLGGDSSGFDAYKKASGFDWLSQEGTKGILGSAAARGLLRSGASAKALMNYGNGMANQYAGSYLQNLLGLSDIGLRAGGLLSDAGKYSTSSETGSSSESKGIGGFLGAILSDIGLKKDISYKFTLPNGVNVYSYRYTFDPNRTVHVGVLAQEVAEKIPEAVVPTNLGYLSVDYGKVLN